MHALVLTDSMQVTQLAKTIKEFVLQRQQVKTKGGSGAGAAVGTGGEGSSALTALLAKAGASHVSSSGGSSGHSKRISTQFCLKEKKARRKERERLFCHCLGHQRSFRPTLRCVGRVGEMAIPVWHLTRGA